MNNVKVNVIPRSRRGMFIYLLLALTIFFGTFFSFTTPVVTLTDNSAAPVKYAPVLSRSLATGENAYRPYMEYCIPDDREVNGVRIAYTSNILRQQRNFVYVKAGETICLGSDNAYSVLNINDENAGHDTGIDIILITPNGDKYTFDNTYNGLGYINTTSHELAGANYDGNNPQGYTPHLFTADQTGVYEVRFHSYSGVRNQSVYDTNGNLIENTKHIRASTNNDPVALSVTSNSWKNTSCTIGSYDITVVSEEGCVQKGRAFTNCLALNMGKNLNVENDSSFKCAPYVVTNDGYIYQCDMQLDPYGFLFFANNHGIVDENANSLYQSYKSKNNNLTISSLGAYIHDPNLTDTTFHQTYRIFFEEPDQELVDVLFPKAYEPETISNVRFIGMKEDNITYEGCGGFFEFVVKNAVSVTIKIDFSEYNSAHDADYADVSLYSSVLPGVNRVFWDGLDGNGIPLPPDIYRSSEVKITINTNVGEVHFPLIDVENATKFSLTRINDIYNEAGEIVSYKYDSNVIYYNNSPVENVNIESGADKKHLADNADHSNDGTEYLSFSNGDGDFTTLDIWKYFYDSEETAMELGNEIIIIPLDDYNSVSLSAYVFWDGNNNEFFDSAGIDSGLADVRTDLDYTYCETRWYATKDDEGRIISLDPVEINLPLTDDEGGTTDRIVGYYHHYKVIAEKDAEENIVYKLYKWNSSDHSLPPEPVKNAAGEQLVVELMQSPADEENTYDIVWIPVHDTTLTDSDGKFSFINILLNHGNGSGKSISDFIGNENFGKYDNITVTVHNPDQDLYGTPTTVKVTYNSTFGMFGRDNTTECQHFTMTQLTDKVRSDRTASPDRKLFSYNAADVGYYYDSSDKPFMLEKTWSSDSDDSGITEIIFSLIGTDEYGVIRLQKDIELNKLTGWKKQLSNLPTTLSYSISSETFVQNGVTYVCSNSNGAGNYGYIDENGELQTADETPFTTIFHDLKASIMCNILTVDNLYQDSAKLQIYKYDIEEHLQLANATFKLQRLEENGAYSDVYSNSKLYTVTTDNNGYACFYGLTEGAYRIVEVAPPRGYSLKYVNQPVDFVISKDSADDDNVSGDYYTGYSVAITNYPEDYSFNGAVEIRKMNPDGKLLDDAVFAVYRADENNCFVTEAPDGTKVSIAPDSGEITCSTTDGTLTVVTEDGTYTIHPAFTEPGDPCYGSTVGGILRFTELRPGSYIIRELKAPSNYKMREQLEFTFLEINSKKTFTFVNDPDPYTLSIKKVDSADTSKTLTGAEFVLYYIDGNGSEVYFTDEGWSAFSGDTLPDTYVFPSAKKFDGLLIDREYYLREVKAPEGYMLLTEPVKITVNNSGTITAMLKGTKLQTTKTKNLLDYTVTVKNNLRNKPTLTKTVREDSDNKYGPQNSADIGQVCDFCVGANFDGCNRSVRITDSMSGLILTGDPFIVTINNKELPQTAYSLTKTDNSFIFELLDSYTATLDKVEPSTLVIRYKAVLTAEAVIAGEGNPNTAELTSYNGNASASTATFSYRFGILKVDPSDEPLAGAEFILSRMSGDDVVYALFEDSKIIGWTADEAAASVLVSGENGTAELAGLDSDDYALTEIKAPQGYSVLSQPIAIKVGEEFGYTVNDEGFTPENKTIRLINYIAVVLPCTGGRGARYYYVLGAMLAAIAVIGMILHRRIMQK